jgi:glycosyltransferase involved in cell wall biosynthesis
MPFVREAVDSVRGLSYRPFELVVQDACSTDGTAEFLSTLGGIERVVFASEPDNGIGDAYNRAIARCEGDVIGSIDSDNLLEPWSLERAVAALEPGEAAAVYGAVTMIDDDGTTREDFVPDAFDHRALMRCELVPPFSTSFFARARCGNELRFDETLRTCADFDLWLRLSDRPISRVTQRLGRTRRSPASMSQDPGRFDQFCADKLAALDAFLRRRPELASEADWARAGIYCWAAESVLALEGASERFRTYVEAARSFGSEYARVARLEATLSGAR